MKPYDSPTGSTWWFYHRGFLDVFVVLDGYIVDETITCRRIFVLHSDDEPNVATGMYSIAEGSPYNDSSTRFA